MQSGWLPILRKGGNRARSEPTRSDVGRAALPERDLTLRAARAQVLIPRRTLLLLSPAGLWLTSLNRPINQLHALLASPEPSPAPRDAALERFVRLYGLDEPVLVVRPLVLQNQDRLCV